MALCAQNGTSKAVNKVFALVVLMMSGRLLAQPLLETGRLLRPGEVLTEVALGGWPLDHGAAGYYGFAQYQVQLGWPIKTDGTRWEPRAAIATGYSPDQLHFSALIGMQYHFKRAKQEDGWDWSAAATTSYLEGDQLIPQHKLWFAGTRAWGATEWNLNGGLCQNRTEGPIHWHAALGFISELPRKWLLHAEAYLQPEGNQAFQVGLEHQSEGFNTIFMVMASPGSIPGPTLVGYTVN
jgi:hypothetical protein